jgi:hypothetical protein
VVSASTEALMFEADFMLDAWSRSRNPPDDEPNVVRPSDDFDDIE